MNEPIGELFDMLDKWLREPCTPSDRMNARAALTELRRLVGRLRPIGNPYEQVQPCASPHADPIRFAGEVNNTPHTRRKV